MQNEPIIAQKSPFVLDLKAGKYHWCSCGASANQPFCDGTHKGTGMKSVVFELEEDKTVYLCGCKQTTTPVYCDGTHKKL